MMPFSLRNLVQVEEGSFRHLPMIFACLMRIWSSDSHQAVECLEIPENIVMLVQQIQWSCEQSL